MRHTFTLLFILLVSFPSLAKMELKLTQEITLMLSQPNTLVHTQDTLLIRYDSGLIMHEHIDPERVFGPSINLTGINSLFFRSLFEPDTMQALPSWLIALAEEQQTSLGISSPVKSFSYRDTHIYHFFSDISTTGHLFLISQNSVQRIEIRKDVNLYRNLVNQLKEHHSLLSQHNTH